MHQSLDYLTNQLGDIHVEKHLDSGLYKPYKRDCDLPKDKVQRFFFNQWPTPYGKQIISEYY